jgi:Flp pilus assembly protein TadD
MESLTLEPSSDKRTATRRAVRLPALLVLAVLAGCAAPAAGPRAEADPQAKLRVAEAAEVSGDRDLAASMYASAAAMAPDDTMVQVRGAMGLARNGKLASARDLLTERLKAKPNDPALLRALASIYLVAGQSRNAIALSDHALAVAPKDLSAMVSKAVALDLEDRHADAQQIYRQALALAPGDAAISNDLALSLLMSGRSREAQDVLVPFEDSDTVPERVKINLGIIYAVNGEMGRAKSLLRGRMDDAELDEVLKGLNRSAASTLIAPK